MKSNKSIDLQFLIQAIDDMQITVNDLRKDIDLLFEDCESAEIPNLSRKAEAAKESIDAAVKQAQEVCK